MIHRGPSGRRHPGHVARLLSALLATVLIAGCGTTDPEPDGPPLRLSAAEYRTLVRDDRQARRAVERVVTVTPRTADRLARNQRRTCRRMARSGPVLRRLAPACEASVQMVTASVALPSQVQGCGENPGCVSATILRLELPLTVLWGADQQARRALSGLRAGDACRDYLLGSDEQSALLRDMILTLRAVKEGQRRLQAAESRRDAERIIGELHDAAREHDRTSQRFAALTLRAADVRPTVCRDDVAGPRS
ncbi:MAG: hypothetical protein AB7G37_18345 [Solirubrobacteraceae bacterium]